MNAPAPVPCPSFLDVRFRKLDTRVRCERPAGHELPHRWVSASGGSAEWDRGDEARDAEQCP